MGKGDKKTRRGKIIKGSYGVRRPRKKTGPVTTGTGRKKASGAKA
ncbi:MAG: 30S ribosomal protein THX [Marinilabiliales bacterium]|nr:MAG: 30S ribosomal protein THX [Marinilabiliales bacterium]